MRALCCRFSAHHIQTGPGLGTPRCARGSCRRAGCSCRRSSCRRGRRTRSQLTAGVQRMSSRDGHGNFHDDVGRTRVVRDLLLSISCARRVTVSALEVVGWNIVTTPTLSAELEAGDFVAMTTAARDAALNGSACFGLPVRWLEGQQAVVRILVPVGNSR